MTPSTNREIDAKLHKHYWHYPHAIIQGRKESEVAVVRYCACGQKQVAFASNWRLATGDYALAEPYAQTRAEARVYASEQARFERIGRAFAELWEMGAPWPVRHWTCDAHGVKGCLDCRDKGVKNA